MSIKEPLLKSTDDAVVHRPKYDSHLEPSASDDQDIGGITRPHAHVPSVCAAVVIALCIKVLVIGMYFSFGSLLPSLLREYQAPESVTAAVGSLGEAAFNLTCLMAGIFVERRGPVEGFAIGAFCFCIGIVGDSAMTHLSGWYVTHVLVGVGMAFSDLAAMSLLHRHTPVHIRGTCVGFASLGAGVGMAAVSYLLGIGIQAVGLRKSLMCAALVNALIMGGLLCGARWLEKGVARIDNRKCVEHATPSSSISMVREHWAFFVGLALYAFGLTVPYNYVKVMALNLRLPMREVDILPVLMGFSDSAGVLIFGLVGDYIRNYKFVFVFMVIGSTACLAVLPSCATFTCYSGFAMSYGSLSGGRAGLLSLVCLERFGQDHVISAYGIACSIFLFSSLGPPVVGAMYDYDGTYESGIYLMAGAMALSIPCFCCASQHSR